MTAQDNNFHEDAEKSQALAIATKAITADQLQLSEKVGAIKATGFFKKVATVSEIKMLAEIKESKQYKGLRLYDTNGNCLQVSTWAEFCQTIGRSHQHIDEDIRNLSAFGEDFLETSQRMGVGYRDLRKLRQLPDSDREVVINDVAVNAGDKETIVELIDDLTAKHAADKAELEKQLADEKAERQATDKVIANKDKKINELSKQLAREETASPYDRATKFAQEISAVETNMLVVFGEIDKLFQAIREDAELPEILRVNQGQLLVALKAHSNEILDRYQLGDISVDDDQLDWVAEAKAAAEKGEIPKYVTSNAE